MLLRATYMLLMKGPVAEREGVKEERGRMREGGGEGGKEVRGRELSYMIYTPETEIV